MSREWKWIILVMLSVLLLVGCGKTLDERATAGIRAAQTAFQLNDKNVTEEIEGVKLYKPAGFSLSENSDAQNIIFTKQDETYILFNNPNEKKDSKLFYELLLADQVKEIVEQATFEEEGVFGFAAVVATGNDRVELIASVGGTKMTTMAKPKNIEEDLTRMMEIVRSIKRDS